MTFAAIFVYALILLNLTLVYFNQRLLNDLRRRTREQWALLKLQKESLEELQGWNDHFRARDWHEKQTEATGEQQP